MSQRPQNQTRPIIRRRKAPSRRRKDGLIRYARNVTSQCGEDGILEHLFSLIPLTENRCCVDVGAWDGVHLSNTYSLLVGTLDAEKSKEDSETTRNDTRTRWKGVLIEADPDRFQALKTLHEPLGHTCLCVEVSCANAKSCGLVQLLKHKTDTPSNFDLLCIDVDGSDYWLMHDVLVSKEYTPKVVCVEFNPTMPQDLIYIPARTDEIRHGASLAALVELAQDHGYILVETTLYNAFFVLNEIYEGHLRRTVPEPTIEALSEVTMGTSLYQLYDGTLKLWGCKKLLWHRLPIREENIQVLAPAQRIFPFAPPPPSSNNHNNAAYSSAVDMSSYCNPSAAPSDQKMRECADMLWSQLCSDGFCLVRGTGISSNVCQSALEATRSFLMEAPETVRRSCLAKDRARRGYSPMCTENFASLIGTKGPNDIVRKFRIGPPQQENNETVSPLLRPNLWPTGQVWNQEDATSFRSAIESYYEASCHAARGTVIAICDGILKQHPVLKDTIEHILASVQNGAEPPQSVSASQQTSILTLLGYSTGSRHKKKPPRPLVAPHTDVGIVTFLIYDAGDCAVLQRKQSKNDQDQQSGDGPWVDVTLPPDVPEDPIFVVNIGDCLSELSNGLLPSTLHRVMAQPHGSTPRSCLALFLGLDPNQKLVFPKKSNGKGTEEITFEEWRRRRIAVAQQMLKESTAVKE